MTVPDLDPSSAASGPGARGTDGSGSGEGSGTSDEVLARRAALGDRGAFAEIVDRHGPALHRYLHRLLDNPGDTEDCLQETFIDAWRGLPTFRRESSLRTWLFTLARHRSYRRQKAFPSSGSRAPLDLEAARGIEADWRSDPARETLDAALLAALDAGLRHLPERQASTWILKEVEGLSYAEIATVLGCTPTAVRGLLERARAGLATTLAEWR